MCKLVEKNGLLYAYTEYNDSFVSASRRLGGKWKCEEKAWAFAIDIKQEVENLLIDLFGYGQEKINIECTTTKKNIFAGCAKYTLFGKTMFRRKGRDQDVILHSDISILKGGFKGSGGSMAHPDISDFKGETFTFIIRNVPKNLLHELPEEISWKERENSKSKSKYSEFTIQQLEEMMAEITQEIELRK